MRKTALYLGCVAALLLVPPADAQTPLQEEVRMIGDQIGEALVEDDFEAVLAHYADDAVSLPMYAPMMRGKEEMRAHHEETRASGMRITSFESEPTQVWKDGETVMEVGTYDLTVRMPDADEPYEDRGKYLTIYERQRDGSLKIVAESWTTDLDPLAPGG